MKIRQFSAAIAFILASGVAAGADTVVLTNGDRLTGVVVDSDGTNLTIDSEFAGTVTIPLTAVQQIDSDQELYLTLADGQTIVGAVAAGANNVQVATAETGVVNFQRSAIRAIRSPAAQTAFEAEIERLQNPGLGDLWRGTVDTGLSFTSGNSDTTTFTLGVNAARATRRDRFGVYATSLFATNKNTGSSTTTANSVRGGIRYDFDVSESVFAFGLTDLEFDEFQQLDLRAVAGGGMGWHVRNDEFMVFDVFGGGNMNKEYFSTGLKRTSGELLLGEELAYQLFSRTTLTQRLVFFPNINETGEFRINFDGSLLTNLNDWLGWNITVSDRYLSNPVIGAKSNDVLLTTGLRLTFGR